MPITYCRVKLSIPVEHKVHEGLGITGRQLTAFRSLLDIDVNALSYNAQQTKLLGLLQSEIPGCSGIDAEVFYYLSAIKVIQGLAIQADEVKRKITKERFLREVNRKDVAFSTRLQQKFGADYYARLIRRKNFHSGCQPASKSFPSLRRFSADFSVV